jgi:hypothetical protein
LAIDKWWPDALTECRRHPGQWRRLDRRFSRSTAKQVASDLRRAHHRATVRVTGLLVGDVWETAYGEAENGDSGCYALWVRYLGPSEQDRPAWGEPHMPKHRRFLRRHQPR